MIVYRTGISEHLATWSPEEISGAARLERAPSFSGPWSEAADVTGLEQVLDVAPADRLVTWHYRLVSEAGTSAVAHASGPPDRHAFAAARYARRHLKRDVKTPAFWLPQPRQGERCEACFDAVRGTRKRTQCDACDGSGFASGYGTPVKLYVSFGADKLQPEQLPTARHNMSQVAMWTANVPLVKEGDFVLRWRDHQLFEVSRVQRTEKSGFVVRQNLMGRAVEDGDPRYQAFSAVPAHSAPDTLGHEAGYKPSTGDFLQI